MLCNDFMIIVIIFMINNGIVGSLNWGLNLSSGMFFELSQARILPVITRYWYIFTEVVWNTWCET